MSQTAQSQQRPRAAIVLCQAPSCLFRRLLDIGRLALQERFGLCKEALSVVQGLTLHGAGTHPSNE